MKYLTAIAGILLGLIFAGLGIMVLLNKVPTPPPPPEGSPAAHFMAAFIPTGYMSFIKVFEVLGGILVAIPKTRNLGLLILGPIIVNIIATTIFVMGGVGPLVQNPVAMAVIILALFLLWAERKAFLGLIHRPAAS